jgi:hypothetical protein
MRKFWSIRVERAQRGWVCTVTFDVETVNQFTPEVHEAQEGSRWLVAAIVKGLLAARRQAASLKARPGERLAKGW